MFKRLTAGFIHLLGGSTAEDVEYIERQRQGKLERGPKPPGAPGTGGAGASGHTPAMSWPSDGPLFIPAAPGPLQTLIITPTAPADKPTAPLHKGTERMSGPERRELARAAAQWCKQQGIEASPENIIFYLENRRLISAHTPETAEKEEKTKPTKCHQCINYGWGMPQCRECNPGNNWKYFQKDL